MKLTKEQIENVKSFLLVQIASPNGHLCHIRRPLRDLIGGQLGTH